MKLCIDCRFLIIPKSGKTEYAKCARGKTGGPEFSPVDGTRIEPLENLYYASTSRNSEMATLCGMEARFFEAKAAQKPEKKDIGAEVLTAWREAAEMDDRATVDANAAGQGREAYPAPACSPIQSGGGK